MEKLIFTSLGIVSISLFFLTFIDNSNDLSKNSVNHSIVNIKSINSETDKDSLEKEEIITSVKSTNNPQKLTIQSSPHKQSEKEMSTLSYLNYRKEQHLLKEKKMRQYLAYQQQLKHIREGGVKSNLEREKRSHEVQFQHYYTSMMMSQRAEKHYTFMKQNREMQKRREQMQSLRERQQLQTKYRGEL